MLMSFDFSNIWESKRALRERLRALPIAEKLRMLEEMRESIVSIRAAKPAQAARGHEQRHYGKKL